MNAFLDDAHKKSISDGIRQMKREEKLLHESAVQDVAPNLSCGIDIIADILQDQAQKGIANSIVESNSSRDIKTVNIVNDQDSIVTWDRNH